MSFFKQISCTGTICIALLVVSTNVHSDPFSGYNMQQNGAASVVDSGNTLRLTPNANSLAGSSFISTSYSVDDSTSFRTFFQWRMHGGSGADGLAFVLHDDSDGASALGDPGFGMGYTTIGPGLIVEFDTWDNGDPHDPDDNHIALHFAGNLDPALVYSPAADFESEDSYFTWVEYDSADSSFRVYFNTVNLKPSEPVFQNAFDLEIIFSGEFFAGFTAGTGGLNNNHDIEDWSFDVFDGPLPLEQTTPVPTMSGIATILMVLILLVVGVARLQRKSSI